MLAADNKQRSGRNRSLRRECVLQRAPVSRLGMQSTNTIVNCSLGATIRSTVMIQSGDCTELVVILKPTPGTFASE